MDNPLGDLVSQSLDSLRKGNFKEAFDVFDFIIEDDPSRKDYWQAKGDVLWELKDYGSSLLCYIFNEQLSRMDHPSGSLMDQFKTASRKMTAEAVEYCKENPHVLEPIDGASVTTRSVLIESRYQEMKVSLSKKIQESPDDLTSYFQMSLANAFLKRYDDAVYYLDELLKRDPHHPEGLYHRVVMLMKLNRYPEAMEDIKKLIVDNINNSNYWEILGDIYSRIHENEEAIASYEHSFVADPTNVASLFKKGVLLGRSGKLDEAFEIYNQVARFKAGGDVEPMDEEPAMDRDSLIKFQDAPASDDIPVQIKTFKKEPASKPGSSEPKAQAGVGPASSSEAAEPVIAPDLNRIVEKVESSPASSEDLMGVEISVIGDKSANETTKEAVSDTIVDVLGSETRRYPAPLSNFSPEDILEMRAIIDSLTAKGGGGSYMYIEPTSMMEYSLFLLTELMSKYRMKGVLVTLDKPYNIYDRLIQAKLGDYISQPPFYIDDVSGISRGSFPEKENVLIIEDSFDLDDLRDSIDLGLHRVSENYSGERYFVMFDNLAALSFYTSPGKIRKFFKRFSADLKKLHIYGFFLVAEGQLNLQLTDIVRNLPNSIFNKMKKK